MTGSSNRRLSTRCWIVLLAAAAMLQTASAEDAVPSREGLYRLAFSPEIEPVVINRLHRWTLHLEDNEGQPVADATLSVSGGMPEHNHGLPTEPRVTAYLGDGRYRLEGMRFHMQGSWEITVSIDARAGKDSVLIRLEL